MQKSGIWLALLMAGLGVASGQVTVEVLLDQDQFLQGESLPVKVRITNMSGETLSLGAEEDWLVFSIESRQGGPVIKTGEAPVQGEFKLESSKKATKQVDLAPYFSLSQPGGYSINATVHLKSWDRQLVSRPKQFDVIEGATLWEQEVGLPKAAEATNTVPEVRRYILQQANHLKTHIQLYLRVTDSSGRVLRVFPIGPIVSFSHPEPQVDRLSNLHLIFQRGPRAFSYTVFNPDGELLVRQTYDISGSRPRLKSSPEGDISVVGGARRVTAFDFPPAPPESPPRETPPADSPSEESKGSKS